MEIKMKKLMMAALFTVLSLNIFARDLDVIMKDMGKVYGPISKTLPTATQITPDMVSNSALLINLIKESAAIIPDTVTSLPTVERDTATARYNAQMNDLLNAAVDLNKALTDGNLDLAKQILAKMNDQKKTSHGEFKN
jgi:hypothetical protein